MKVRHLIHQLQGKGWYCVRIRGSHRQFQHYSLSGTVTVPGKPNRDIHPKTLKRIQQQATGLVALLSRR